MLTNTSVAEQVNNRLHGLIPMMRFMRQDTAMRALLIFTINHNRRCAQAVTKAAFSLTGGIGPAGVAEPEAEADIIEVVGEEEEEAAAEALLAEVDERAARLLADLSAGLDDDAGVAGRDGADDYAGDDEDADGDDDLRDASVGVGVGAAAGGGSDADGDLL